MGVIVIASMSRVDKKSILIWQRLLQVFEIFMLFMIGLGAIVSNLQHNQIRRLQGLETLT